MKMLFAVVLTALLAVPAYADPIEGDIAWAGLWDEVDGTFSWTGSDVILATGDLAAGGITPDTEIDMADINTPFTGPLVLWVAKNFTYVLESLSVVHNGGSFYDLYGHGTLSHPDFDDTPYALQVSTNGGVLQSFSAAGQNVPEPGAFVLLGAGLAGVALLRRRSFAQQRS